EIVGRTLAAEHQVVDRSDLVGYDLRSRRLIDGGVSLVAGASHKWSCSVGRKSNVGDVQGRRRGDGKQVRRAEVKIGIAAQGRRIAGGSRDAGWISAVFSRAVVPVMTSSAHAGIARTRGGKSGSAGHEPGAGIGPAHPPQAGSADVGALTGAI